MFKDFRKQRNMTQQQFADALGVTLKAVQSWEQGVKIPGRRSRIALRKVGFDLDLYDKKLRRMRKRMQAAIDMLTDV